MIEVNEYVRIKDGEIGIFDRYSSRKENSLYKSPFNCFIKIKNRKTPLQCCEDYIVKHSKQLIDLIEVGDIVNGYRVINVINEGLCPSGKCIDIDSSKDSSECTLWEEDIKTILTKEQYMANCYKVGGEDE